jgi:succinate dehydrogenase/fumarate reductase flavoprotein subunit
MSRVVVVGGGNAGLCAAIAAREAWAEVCLLERAPEALRGGNSAFTAGLMRTVYDVGDVLRLVGSLTDEELARTDFGSYTVGDGRVMPGLYACGAMLGGLFYLNYPGGSGLTAGAVFGRIAGRNAAAISGTASVTKPRSTVQIG